MEELKLTIKARKPSNKHPELSRTYQVTDEKGNSGEVTGYVRLHELIEMFKDARDEL